MQSDDAIKAEKIREKARQAAGGLQKIRESHSDRLKVEKKLTPAKE